MGSYKGDVSKGAIAQLGMPIACGRPTLVRGLALVFSAERLALSEMVKVCGAAVCPAIEAGVRGWRGVGGRRQCVDLHAAEESGEKRESGNEEGRRPRHGCKSGWCGKGEDEARRGEEAVLGRGAAFD